MSDISDDLLGDEVTVWRVWYPADGGTLETARPIKAFDAEAAAEKWAEDENIYPVCEIEVNVADADGEVRTYVVTVEAVPSYHATEKP